MKLGPTWFRRLIVRFMPLPAVQRFRKVVDVLDSTATQIFMEKKESVSKIFNDGKAGQAELAELKDVMSLTREFIVYSQSAVLRVDAIYLTSCIEHAESAID